MDDLSAEQVGMLLKRGVSMNDDLPSHRMLPLADMEVPSDADAFLAKCVEADYEAADRVPRNTRVDVGQWYFGWMPMKSAEIVQLWHELEFNDLERLTPRMVAGRQPEIWENDAW